MLETEASPKFWLAQATSEQRRTLIAASLGWMLDSMDVMLYSMVLTHLMRDLQISTRTAGLLASVTLISSALGGVLFGILADRIGRTRAMMGSILIYSIFTGACGLAANLWQLGLFRIFLGLGIGGEWAAGAALVSETWPSKHRGKALGIMQSSWAVGYAAAAALTALILPRYGWRAVFWAGVTPALLTLWIRYSVPEPEVWKKSRMIAAGRIKNKLADLFSSGLNRSIAVATVVNSGTMFAWWGLFTWIPSYLGLPAERGGAGLDIVKTSTWIILMQVGMWFGYVTFGFISDRVGRRLTYVGYLLIAALLVPIYGAVRDPGMLLWLGPLVAFFGTGYFTGFGIITAELFPTRIRVTAQGLTYNIGRAFSALAPFAVGSLATRYGLGLAFNLVAAAFLFSACMALLLPETKGREIVAD
ncbi:MAG TPA: MFS transporter [Acidobacteriota bacterium]|jgi:MFS family permease